MSKHFGTTWWGKRWLQALTSIDYSNRLPRGSRYARRGMVTDLTIEDNRILAAVEGSRPKPYNVQVVLPPFDEDRLDSFIEAIANKPSLVFSLLNNELSPEIEQLATEVDLKLFPSSWMDLKMNCSCPDWAVPCKHIAAVIYQISREIDNNPYILFDIHRAHFVDLLQDAGVTIDQKSLTLPTIMSLRMSKSTYREEASTELTIEELAFAELPSMIDEMINILPSWPSFADGSKDFKLAYARSLKAVIKAASTVVDTTGQLPGTPSSDFFVEHGDQVVLYPISDTAVGARVDEYWCPIEDLIRLLNDIPNRQLVDYSQEIIALRMMQSTSLHLLSKGLVVPRIATTASDESSIQWMPASINKEVKDILDVIDMQIPPGLYQDGQGQDMDLHVDELMSMFITSTVHILASEINSRFDQIPILELFFLGLTNRFDQIGETETPIGIQKWLARYGVVETPFIPRILVRASRGEKLQLSIDLLDRRSADSQQVVQLSNFMSDREWQSYHTEVYKNLGILSTYIQELNQYIDDGALHPIQYDLTSFSELMFETLPVVELLQIPVLLPKELRHLIRPKATMQISRSSPGSSQGIIRLDKELSFDWQVALGDDIIPPSKFKELLDGARTLIKYKKNYIHFRPDDIKKLLKQLDSPPKVHPMRILAAALEGEYLGAKVKIDADLRQKLEELLKVDEIQPPEDLIATLRPYQHRGYGWLYKNAQLGFGSVLADDMGLGKTIQVIAYMLKCNQSAKKNASRFLVIAPTSLLSNWANELNKFAPSLSVWMYHGTERKGTLKNNSDVVITTYGIARNDHKALSMSKWHTIVIDEAQHIKNPQAEQSKAIKKISADNYIAMSGTPVENRLSELWSIFDFTNKQLLGTQKQFSDVYGKPIERYNDLNIAEKLQKVTAPFLMRRLKTDKSIISDLPDKIEVNAFATLTPEQSALYQGVVEEAMAAINGISVQGSGGTSMDHKDLFKRQGLILQMILSLKQICNHPAQFLKSGMEDPKSSGKLTMLFDRLDNILELREKVLIFTQYKEMGGLLERFINDRYKTESLFYHGGLTRKKREAMVDRFQHEKHTRVFILTIKSAGTGLNLTAAQHVIHYDLWWNPAVEAQATDRAYRIGQSNNVFVHRLITKHTFEERINLMIQQKRHLAELTVKSGEKWVGELSNSDLKSFFELSPA